MYKITTYKETVHFTEESKAWTYLSNYFSSNREAERAFDENLDESYPCANVAGYHFDTSEALKKLDPIAYREEYLRFIESKIKEAFQCSPSNLYGVEIVEFHVEQELVENAQEYYDSFHQAGYAFWSVYHEANIMIKCFKNSKTKRIKDFYDVFGGKITPHIEPKLVF